MNFNPGCIKIQRQSNKFLKVHIFFYRQLDFPSEPGYANEILENEPESCLAVA